MKQQVNLLVTLFMLFWSEVISQDSAGDLAFHIPDDAIEGKDVIMTCQVSALFIDGTDMVTIYRKSNSELTSLVNNDRRFPSAPDNVQWSGWVWNESTGKGVLFMSILNVRRSDSGVYECAEAMPIGPTNFQIRYQQEQTLDVLFLPSGQPLCSISTPNETSVWNAGDEVTLYCSSEVGNPPVALQWSSTGNISIPTAEVFRGHGMPNVLSILIITLDASFDDILFSCKRQISPLIPSNATSCFLGPFAVQRTTQKPLTLNQTVVANESAADLQAGAIVAIVLVILVILFLIAIVSFLVKTGRCDKSLLKKNRLSLMLQRVPLAKASNENATTEDNCYNNAMSPDNIKASIILPNKPQNISGSAKSNSKAYPAPPSYPRPPKISESNEGEQYANIDKLSAESTETTVYANASDCIPCRVKSEASTEGLPQSPAESSKPWMTHTPGLEYADLDLARPASLGTERDTIKSNNDSVVYAAVLK